MADNGAPVKKSGASVRKLKWRNDEQVSRAVVRME